MRTISKTSRPAPSGCFFPHLWVATAPPSSYGPHSGLMCSALQIEPNNCHCLHLFWLSPWSSAGIEWSKNVSCCVCMHTCIHVGVHAHLWVAWRPSQQAVESSWYLLLRTQLEMIWHMSVSFSVVILVWNPRDLNPWACCPAIGQMPLHWTVWETQVLVRMVCDTASKMKNCQSF